MPAHRPNRGFKVGSETPNTRAACSLVNPAKKRSFHQIGLPGVVGGESLQRVAQGEQLFVVHICRSFESIQVHALRAASVTKGLLAAGIVNEDAAHRFGGGCEEVRAILPFPLFVAAEPQPRFMNQRRGLQRLTGFFSRAIFCAASLRNSS